MKLIICGPWCTKLFELVINRDKPFKLHISKVNEDGRGTAQPQHTNYSDSNGPGCCQKGAGWVYRTQSARPPLTAGRLGRYGEGVAKHPQHLWVFASLGMAGEASL